MVKQNIVKDNKLIAEFIGLAYCEKHMYTGWYKNSEFNHRICDFDGLKYHSSWDWLMPVVSLCLSKLDILLHKNVKDSYTDLEWEYLEEIALFKEKFKWSFERPIIENCFKQVIEFIKWYNSCQKEK